MREAASVVGLLLFEMERGEEMAANQIFIVSVFNHKRDTYPKLKQITWQEICAMVAHPKIRKDKDGQLISPATFEPSYRLKKNVKEVSMLAMDYDHQASIETDFAVWQAMGFCCTLYTTHSHLRVTDKNPKAEPRFRIILPLASPILSKFYPSLWQWAQKFTGGKLDEATKDASRMFYTPATHSINAKYEYRISDGKPLDWHSLNLSPEPAKVIKKKRDKKKGKSTIPAALRIDDENIIKAAREKFGAKFDRLLSGSAIDYPDPKSGLPDDSRADNGFAVMLCLVGASDEQVELIWRNSGRNREKLDDHKTYISRTIDAARKWIATHQEEGNDITIPSEIDSDSLPITSDKKRNDYLMQVARNAAKMLDAIRLLFLYLGLKGNHNRILSALLRKGRDKLRPFEAKHEWLLEQYVANGEKITTERTVSRDIHRLIVEQDKLGVEVIRYWQGYTDWRTGVNHVSRFQNLFVRYALETINEAINRSGEFEYSWQALEAAAQEVAARIPRKPTLVKETEMDREKPENARKEKQKAIRQVTKYLRLVLVQNNELETLEVEAQDIYFQALARVLEEARLCSDGQECPLQQTGEEVFDL